MTKITAKCPKCAFVTRSLPVPTRCPSCRAKLAVRKPVALPAPVRPQNRPRLAPEAVRVVHAMRLLPATIVLLKAEAERRVVSTGVLVDALVWDHEMARKARP